MQSKAIHRKDSKEMFSSVEFSLSKANMRLAADIRDQAKAVKH